MSSDVDKLNERTEKLIGALTGAILASAEAAAERIDLAASVAAIRSRMAAFTAVLESVAAQKDAVQGQLANARGATRALLRKQIELLDAQEMAILAKIGLPAEVAIAAISVADAPPEPHGEIALYKREGKRFIPLGNGKG